MGFRAPGWSAGLPEGLAEQLGSGWSAGAAGGGGRSAWARGWCAGVPEEAGESPGRRGRAPGGRRATEGAGVEPVTSRGPRRLAKPKPVRVRATDSGRPQTVGHREVDAVRESWLVEDRWWTDAPLRRRYWEVVTADGRDLVVFRDLIAGRWYAQR